MNPFEELVAVMAQAAVDYDKFYQKDGINKAAATRLRIKMSTIARLSREVRKFVLERKAEIEAQKKAKA